MAVYFWPIAESQWVSIATKWAGSRLGRSLILEPDKGGCVLPSNAMAFESRGDIFLKNYFRNQSSKHAGYFSLVRIIGVKGMGILKIVDL